MDDIVDAIEEGQIVRVPLAYAQREGLFVLKRKAETVGYSNPHVPLKYSEKVDIEQGARRRRSTLDLDKFRKPLHVKNNPLYGDLVENFQWEILKARKSRGLSRRQVATALGENEESIKLIENGVLAGGNYILLNKLEQHFGLKLRKNPEPLTGSLRSMVDQPARSSPPAEPRPSPSSAAPRERTALSGAEIELID